jgi:hypothetical protein
VNNSCEDGKLYFLTSHHCLDEDDDGNIDYDASNTPTNNMGDWNFWWNYESLGCSNPSSDPYSPSKTSSGGTLIANSVDGDFALIELTGSPYQLTPPIAAFYSGWNRSATPGAGGKVIGHPQGDIKKIATYSQVPGTASAPTPGFPGSYWSNYFIGTTNGHSVIEHGSSGSPIYDNTERAIGITHSAIIVNCSNLGNNTGYFSKINYIWDNQSTHIRQLKHWLDPCSINPTVLDGGFASPCFDDVLVSYSINSIKNIRANETITALDEIGSFGFVSFKANEEVKLINGFSVENGAIFEIENEPCTASFVISNKLGDQLSIESLSKDEIKSNSQILPNPNNSEYLTIKYMAENNTSHSTIEISRITGEKLIEINYENDSKGLNSRSISIQNLIRGVYVVKVLKDKKTETFKLVRY